MKGNSDAWRILVEGRQILFASVKRPKPEYFRENNPYRSFFPFFAIVLLLLCIGTGYLYFPSLFFQNLGWLHFTRFALSTESTSSSTSLANAQVNFQQSLAWNRHNRRAWLGQAIVAAQQQDTELAASSWPQTGLSPEQITRYGLLLGKESPPHCAAHIPERNVALHDCPQPSNVCSQ